MMAKPVKTLESYYLMIQFFFINEQYFRDTYKHKVLALNWKTPEDVLKFLKTFYN